jgi:predicted  nucleic acid-binding Zn-ribbon protein
VKASPQSQLRLLELADLDTQLSRLAHRRQSLPEVAELASLEARAGGLKDGLTETETAIGDQGTGPGRA